MAVMGLNPGWVELGVRSTSVQNILESKIYMYTRQFHIKLLIYGQHPLPIKDAMSCNWALW